MTKKSKISYEEKKQMFQSPVLEMLRSEKPISKWEMVEKLEVSERTIRDMISECSMYYAVLALSNKEGYRLARKIDEMNQEEKEIEAEEVKHQLNEFNSRIKVMKKRMKPLIAYLKVLEKNMEVEK